VFRNILAAVDSSPTAQRALVVAGELAEALNARLTVITVAPGVPPGAARTGADVKHLEQQVEAEADQILRAAVDSLPEGLPVTKILRHGHAGERIVEQLAEGDHDLLVMGTRARSRMISNLFGSVAAHVHFHANVAMLVIHPEEEEEEE
jgi:nucleotide-binding universal stress UspA family protein